MRHLIIRLSAIFVVFTLLMLVASFIFGIAFAQEEFTDYKNSVLREDLKNNGDGYSADLVSQLLVKQSDFYELWGRFWQGTDTFDIPPPSATSPDYRDLPDDESIDWVDFGLELPLNTQYAFRVDNYSGPSGDGYVLFISVENFDGTIFRKIVNIGPEESRSRDWHVSPLMKDALL